MEFCLATYIAVVTKNTVGVRILNSYLFQATCYSSFINFICTIINNCYRLSTCGIEIWDGPCRRRPPVSTCPVSSCRHAAGGSFPCGACSRRPRAPAHVPHDADVPPEQRPVHVGHLVVRITPARLLLLAWLACAGPFASGNGA